MVKWFFLILRYLWRVWFFKLKIVAARYPVTPPEAWTKGGSRTIQKWITITENKYFLLGYLLSATKDMLIDIEKNVHRPKLLVHWMQFPTGNNPTFYCQFSLPIALSSAAEAFSKKNLRQIW